MADTNERITRMARMAERLREHAASVSDEECRDAWTQEAADIDWLIARATATPPADAAPSNAARRTGKDRAVNALRSITADYQPADAALAEKAAVDCLRACAQAMRIFDRPDTAAEVDRATDAIAAALRARAVPEGKKYHDVAQRLYALLDDIDTAGDIAKSDDKLYRVIVERIQAKKRDFVVSCDGYTVTLADDSMLAASKEAP